MRVLVIVAVLLAAAPAFAQALAPPGAAACSGCHGASGEAKGPASLRGQSPDDIVAAMRAFRTGERPATVMDRIAKGFDDQETRAIASWVSREH
jgi:cytochrome c553